MGGQIDWGEKFRNLGDDVSGAITMRKEAAFKRAEMAKKTDLEVKTRVAKQATADKIGGQYGDTARTFYNSGELDDYTKLEKLKIDAQEARTKAAAARGEGGDSGGLKGIKRYFETLNSAAIASKAMNEPMQIAYESLQEAKKSGNQQEIEKYTLQVNAYAGANEKIAELLKGIIPQEKGPDPLDVELSKDANKTDLVNATVTGAIEKGKVLNSKTQLLLENSKSNNQVGYDLSGVPSKKDLDTFKLSAVATGKLSKKEVIMIDKTDDPKALAAVANDDGASDAVRQLAGAKYKRVMAGELMQVKPQATPEDSMGEAQNQLGGYLSKTPIADKMKKAKRGK